MPLSLPARPGLLVLPLRAVAGAILLCAALGASGQDAVAPGAAAAEPGWSLQRLLTSALASHPSIRAQQALVGAAAAGVEAARWQYFPTPSLSVQSAGSAASDPNYRGDRSVTVLALSQPLWTWGRLEAGVDKASAQHDAALAGRNEARLSLALRLLQSYGEWQGAHARQQAYVQGLQQHQRLRQQVQRRVDEGQAAASDLTLADGRLATMRADLAQATLQEAVARERLAVLAGEPLSQPALASEPAAPHASLGQLAVLLERAQAVSPAMARLYGQQRAQQAVVAELQARLKPELAARLENQHGNFSVAGAPQQTRIFVALNTQLGAGLSSVAAVTEALQRQQSLLAEIEAQRRTLAEQLVADHVLLVGAVARRDDLQRAIAASDGVLQSWDRQYLGGRKTWQDLMNAAREQVQARAQLSEFDAACLVASWRLGLLTGEIAYDMAGAEAPARK